MSETARALSAVTRWQSPDHRNPLEGLVMAGPEDTRKPLARVIRRSDVPRLGVRRTIRANDEQDAKWQLGAAAERLELSEYLRECIDIGHSMKEAHRLTRRTSA